MATDLVSRLGSRALVPGEVRTAMDVPAYVARMVRPGIAAQLAELAHGRSRSLRRVDPDRVLSVLAALAAPTGEELNRVRLGAMTGIPPTTLPPYVDLLVALGLVDLLPGCRSSVAKRAIGRPQAMFSDPAVALHLSGHGPEQLAEFGGRRRLAPLLRNLVATELVRQRGESGVDYRLGHLRERNGLAVDLVIELPDDTVYGVEVRTAAALRPHQFDALGSLAARAGSRFRGGIVLNTAPVGHVYGPRMWSLPVAALWEG